MSLYESFQAKLKTHKKSFAEKITESERQVYQLFIGDKDREIIGLLNDYDNKIESRDRRIIRRRG